MQLRIVIGSFIDFVEVHKFRESAFTHSVVLAGRPGDQKSWRSWREIPANFYSPKRRIDRELA